MNKKWSSTRSLLLGAVLVCVAFVLVHIITVLPNSLQKSSGPFLPAVNEEDASTRQPKNSALSIKRPSLPTRRKSTINTDTDIVRHVMLPWNAKNAPRYTRLIQSRDDNTAASSSMCSSPSSLQAGGHGSRKCTFHYRGQAGLFSVLGGGGAMIIDSIGKRDVDLSVLNFTSREAYARLGDSAVVKSSEEHLSPNSAVVNSTEKKVKKTLPLRPVMVFWNTENWSGRREEWGAKFKTMWLNKTVPTPQHPQTVWHEFDLVASFEQSADVVIPYAHQFPALQEAIEAHLGKMPIGGEELLFEKLPADGGAFQPTAMSVASNCFTRYPQGIVERFRLKPPKKEGAMPRHRADLASILGSVSPDDQGSAATDHQVRLNVSTFGMCSGSNGANPNTMLWFGKQTQQKKGGELPPSLLTPQQVNKFFHMKRHLFYLSFENSVYPDYVTEKLYEPLAAGSIPVYLGAPNVHDFVPTTNVLINVMDFSSPEALVSYLHCVSQNSSVAAQYLEWRTRPLFSRWKRLTTDGQWPLCSICDRVHDVYDTAKELRSSATHDGMEEATKWPFVGTPPRATPLGEGDIHHDEEAKLRAGSQKPIPCSVPK